MACCPGCSNLHRFPDFEKVGMDGVGVVPRKQTTRNRPVWSEYD